MYTYNRPRYSCPEKLKFLCLKLEISPHRCDTDSDDNENADNNKQFMIE